VTLDSIDQNDPTQSHQHCAVVDDLSAGHRLDQVAAKLFAEFSRSRLQQWIKTGELLVDGVPKSVDHRLKGGEELVICAAQTREGEWVAQPIMLDIIHQDADIIVLNKPIGLVVHPAPGNWDGTLLNGLLYQFPQLREVPRAGIVHRLDKDTSGLMVVAKTLQAHAALVAQLQARTVKREYEALVYGRVTTSGVVDRPIGRHPKARTKMAVIESGKQAVTHYAVIQRYGHCSHLRVQLETGRTHQIRVHMAHIRHPLVGDAVYGGRALSRPACGAASDDIVQGFPRQALHAAALGLDHPQTGKAQRWCAPLPADFGELLRALDAADNR
jgi:23S rRNA pseudouridine1911/1915/1917 synthase